MTDFQAAAGEYLALRRALGFKLTQSERMLRRWRTAWTMSPVPASPLERIMAAPSPIRRRASPSEVAPHTNGIVKRHLSM